MPAWITHLDLATKVYNKLEKAHKNNNFKNFDKIDKNAYLFGNVIADCERYVVEDYSFFVPWNISHFKEDIVFNSINLRLPSVDKFLEKYKNKIENPVILGYFTHLYTDCFWNIEAYGKKTILNQENERIGVRLNNDKIKICDKIETTKMKHKDFALFQDYLKSTKEFDIPKFDMKLVKYLKDVEELPYEVEDIKKCIKYIEDNKECENLSYNYQIFTKEAMNILHNRCIDNVCNEIIKIFK